MPRQIMVSEKEALNILLPGGGYKVESAINMSTASEQTLVLTQGYKTALLYPNAACYMTFDVGTAAAIASADNLVLAADQYHQFTIPYDIGEFGTGSSGVVLHVQATASGAGQTCRVVLT